MAVSLEVVANRRGMVQDFIRIVTEDGCAEVNIKGEVCADKQIRCVSPFYPNGGYFGIYVHIFIGFCPHSNEPYKMIPLTQQDLGGA